MTRVPPECLSLESRVLLSADVIGTRLAIAGAADADTIIVSLNQAGTRFQVRINDQPMESFDIEGIQRVVVRGKAGNDTITIDEENGSIGRSWLIGGRGNDTITGGTRTLLYGSSGDDVLNSNGREKRFDFHKCGSGNDTFNGADTNDNATGGEGDDTLFGNGGNDQLSDPHGNDSIDGGDGDDFLNGRAGDDTMIGGEGDDELYGYGGNDSMVGGAGNDFFKAGSGADTLEGGDGNDRLGAGDDSDIDVIRGDNGDDTLVGDSDEDDLDGGTGTNELIEL